MSGYLSWDARASFGASGGEFQSVTTPTCKSPLLVVANVAVSHLEAGGELELPPGYDVKTLEQVEWISGYYNKPFRVSGRQADEIKQIGSALLDLDEKNALSGRGFEYGERSLVEYLVDTVKMSQNRQAGRSQSGPGPEL